MTLRDEYVMALEEENDQLREKIVTLEEMLGLRVETPLMLGLTGQQSKLFGILLKRDLVTKDAAMAAIYGNKPNSEVEIKVVDVFVCQVRKKLKPYEIMIETVWGRGYRMPGPSKVIAAALLEQSRAA
jgi:two-component system, cell cycle response regulator CtrA